MINTADKTHMFNGVYDLKGDTLKIVHRGNEGWQDRARDLINPAPVDWFIQLERQP